MHELTDEQLAKLELALEALAREIESLLSATREGSRPVGLDEPIGRLTRMEAIQQQSMTAAGRRDLDLRLRLVRQALGDIARGRFGMCRRCDEPIGYRRLSARPESPYCLECQEQIDLKHGSGSGG